MRKPFVKSAGFTLLELIIAISLLAIVLTGGIASFISYNQAQSLNTAALDVITMLNKAKSRAQSQVKPNACTSLDGYRVENTVLDSGGISNLYAVCGVNDVPIENKILPKITFNGSTTASILFKVISGGVVGEGNIVVNGYGQTKTINVDKVGNISIN